MYLLFAILVAPIHFFDLDPLLMIAISESKFTSQSSAHCHTHAKIFENL
jgi:hypothetical protein